MEAIKDLIFGDPVYDRRGRVVRRNFGIKNALVIILIVYGLYSLRGKMGIKSGRRKLRGGSWSWLSPGAPKLKAEEWAGLCVFLLFMVVAVLGLLSSISAPHSPLATGV